MSVYCEMINLERDGDRRAHMGQELARADVHARFYPAFDYRKDGTEEMHRQCRSEGPWGPFHPQNMACTISHARAWERFLQTDAQICLMLEDDIHISPDLGAWLSDLSWWPKDADLVKVERWHGPRTRVLMEPPVTHHRGRDVVRILSRHVGSAGYMITRAAAQTLLDSRPFDISIDNLLFNTNASRVVRKMKIYQITPAMVLQGNEPPGRVAGAETRRQQAGWARTRQKLKRGYYEVAYPLTTLFKALTGRARIARVPYEANTLDAP